MRDVSEFAALIMAQYFKSQISNYKKTKISQNAKHQVLVLEVRPMLRSISISGGRGKRIGNFLWNLTIMKKVTAL